MIQAVVTPEQRAGMGMHYTSVTNIQQGYRPALPRLARREYRRLCRGPRQDGGRRQLIARATQRLRALLDRLAGIRFFDPACGSGNFLIVRL